MPMQADFEVEQAVSHKKDCVFSDLPPKLRLKDTGPPVKKRYTGE